jgi:hypothetical protein
MPNLKGFISSIVAPSLVVRSDQPGHANESMEAATGAVIILVARRGGAAVATEVASEDDDGPQRELRGGTQHRARPNFCSISRAMPTSSAPSDRSRRSACRPTGSTEMRSCNSSRTRIAEASEHTLSRLHT